MTTSGRLRREPGQRATSDEGAALIEFALVAILLFTLVFGIIQFGLILSFKQDMTRAAAEGARGGAVAYSATNAEADARSRTTEAIRQFGQDRFDTTDPCDSAEGLTCTVDLVDCATAETEVPTTVVKDCILVDLVYEYKENPLFGDIPLISVFYPDVVRSKSVAKVNS